MWARARDVAGDASRGVRDVDVDARDAGDREGDDRGETRDANGRA